MFLIEPDYISFNGDEWVNHLINHPNDEIYCDWKKLSRKNWLHLLIKEPQFIKELPIGMFSSIDWIKLINMHPIESVVDRCEWNVFSLSEINSMLKHKSKNVSSKVALFKIRNKHFFQKQFH